MQSSFAGPEAMMESQFSREVRPSHGIAKDVRSKIREKVVVADLARELAHELNNPLEALVNLIYLARQETARRRSEGDARRSGVAA